MSPGFLFVLETDEARVCAILRRGFVDQPNQRVDDESYNLKLGGRAGWQFSFRWDGILGRD